MNLTANCFDRKSFLELFLSTWSNLHDRIMPVFNAVLPEALKLMSIQYWFSALPHTWRGFSRFFNSFDDIVYTILYVQYFLKISPSLLQVRFPVELRSRHHHVPLTCLFKLVNSWKFLHSTTYRPQRNLLTPPGPDNLPFASKPDILLLTIWKHNFFSLWI